MQILLGKHIILGVSGGIAAYKAAELVRRLRDAGATVRVVMTTGAQAFVTPLTFQALSGNPVHTALLDPAAEAGMGHIELARWADLVLIAPASANLISRLAQGRGDDLLATICLATEAPIALAPSMNRVMWADAATQSNIEILQTRGMHRFGPAEGPQACGEVGEGRMMAVSELVERSAGLFLHQRLAGRRVTITAGPTREAIDPVRYLSNRSSGRMGFAMAEAAREAGATVTLIAGPVHLPTPPGVERIDVVSAAEMLAAVQSGIAMTDIFIAAAAVADYRPVRVAKDKIKKSDATLSLEMARTEDILATVASRAERPFCVGFAAETHDLADYARDKLERKQLDMVAANDVSQPGIGFDSEDNALLVLWRGGEKHLARARKTELARHLITLISERLSSR
ncbi:MAG: bifunctional phosphopantothenoylcysteine decarboxylase/phosphopantothenate--cysteine ligase CoaBC [Gammaproteobacteria bacterium]|nr:bifunctional phosphopantothenoylcysteine decarboxylase/phosphopantothenate--cysteine ligase CoaBC [Gammaproteobacteria bacterium]MCP5137570.1 bifunctional phosphopantothenoylcysteine decarboxylase/phosphopantothenate--cysteine ligase CoaBC [Gammaproteobacteria bacterium]